MSVQEPSRELDGLIQRLRLVQNKDIIKQFHALLDLFDQSTHKNDRSIEEVHLRARIEAAEKSIQEGTILPQSEFKSEVKSEVQAWIAAKG